MTHKISSKVKIQNSWYTGKSYFPVLIPGKLCPDLLREPRARLVYSFLAFRDRLGKPVHASEIMNYTGVMRSSTLPKILAELQGLGLTNSSGKTYQACQPLDGWFVERNSENEHWSDKLASFRYYCLSEASELTLTQNLVLWTLYSLSKDGIRVDGQSKSGLSKMIGSTWATIHEAIKTLEKLNHLKIIGRTQDRFYAGLYKPSPLLLSGFADASQEKSKFKAEVADFNELEHCPDESVQSNEDDNDSPYSGVEDKLKECGIPKKFWKQVFIAYDTNEHQLIQLFKDSMTEHKRSKAKNPELPGHFGFLLSYKIEQFMGVYDDTN